MFVVFRHLAQANAAMACEPRHVSWFTPEADKLLADHQVSRVAADPPRAPADHKTYESLAKALTRLEIRVTLHSPEALKINAESMADAIIGALGGDG